MPPLSHLWALDIIVEAGHPKTDKEWGNELIWCISV